jgi:hypothetical protein
MNTEALREELANLSAEAEAYAQRYSRRERYGIPMAAINELPTPTADEQTAQAQRVARIKTLTRIITEGDRLAAVTKH